MHERDRALFSAQQKHTKPVVDEEVASEGENASGVDGDRVISLPHSYSTLELHHTRNTRRRRFTPHLPSALIAKILIHLPPKDLSATLCVSRLFFHLSSPLLYSTLDLDSLSFERVLKGAAAVYESQTGKVEVGKKRFKDRLLRFTHSVHLHSHGDEEDDDDEESDDDDDDDTRNSTRNGTGTPARKNSTPRSSTCSAGPCPNVPLNVLMPQLQHLRITLSGEYDYHETFCCRYPESPTCPLLAELQIERFVVYGARSPLLVLPIAFPIPKLVPQPTRTSEHAENHIFPRSASTITLTTLLSPPLSPTKPGFTPPRLVTPSLTPPSSGVSTPAAAHVRPPFFRAYSSEDLLKRRSHTPVPAIPVGAHHRTHRHAHTNLPLGIKELTIILPSGRSYDAKDYLDHAHIFHRGEPSLQTIEKMTLVFEPSPSHAHERTQHRPHNTGGKWQIAYYDSRSSNATWTSYQNLIEDIVIASISLPLSAQVTIVGTENIDGELLNVGMAAVREGRVGTVIQERIWRRIEVRLGAEGRDHEVLERTRRVAFESYADYKSNDEGR